MFDALFRFSIAAAATALLYAGVAVAAMSGLRAWLPDDPEPIWALSVDLGALALALLFAHRMFGRWVFGSRRPALQALPRFLAAAAACIALNEAVFYAVLAYTPLDYPVALSCTLAGCAALAFTLMRNWVFAR